MLDKEFDSLEANEVNNNNTYIFSYIGGYNIVIKCLLTGWYSISSIISVAKDIVRSFPNLKFALIVGIRGGALM